MPTYEYVCTACDNHWEEVQKISADPLEVCPKCHASTAKRQISGGNFILKGGGWYADLYSSQPKPKSGGEGKTEASASAAPAKSDGATSPAASTGAGASSGASSGSSGGSSGSSSASPSGGAGGSTSSGSSGSSGGGTSGSSSK